MLKHIYSTTSGIDYPKFKTAVKTVVDSSRDLPTERTKYQTFDPGCSTPPGPDEADQSFTMP
jgi:hypothetical protein